MSLTDLSNKTGLSRFIIVTILKKDLKVSKHAAKFIPHELTDAQKATRKEVCEENIQTLCDSEDPEDFIQSIVTGDETWLCTFEPDVKQKNSVWLGKGEPHPKVVRPDRFGRKTMLTLFCDCRGPVHIEFLAPGTTIDAASYVQTLKNLKESIRRK